MSQFDDPAYRNSGETESPAVERVDRYLIDGVEFPTFKKAIEARENKIEAFARQFFTTTKEPIHPGDRIKFVEWLLTNRKELRRLLNY